MKTCIDGASTRLNSLRKGWLGKSCSIGRSAAFLLATAPLISASDIPRGWAPNIDAEYIDQIVTLGLTGKDGRQSAYNMGQYGSIMAAVWDAKLLETYISLSQKLSPREAAALKEDQEGWLARRRREAEDAGETEKGGSGERILFTERFVEMTKARVEKLEKRFFALSDAKAGKT